MIITTDIAQPIVDKMIDVIDYNVNIMNHEGVIVASGDKGRIYQTHQGALEAIELKRERIIHQSDYKQMLGTNLGVNVPIEINDKIVGVVGITGEPTKIYKYIQIIKITVENILKQQLLIDQLRFKTTALEEWVQNLIKEDFNNIPLLESQADYFNIDISSRCVITSIEIQDFNKGIFDYELLQKNETNIIRQLRLYFPQSFFQTYLGKGLFILALPVKNENDVKEVKKGCQKIYNILKEKDLENYIGIGTDSMGVLGYRNSYFESKHSIDMLKKINEGKRVAHIKEWGLLRLLTHIPPAINQHYLESFFEQRPELDSETLSTLATYLENNMNIKEASKSMHIHRNTLVYRLDKIKQLWGLDPRNFDDAMKLKIISLCQKLK